MTKIEELKKEIDRLCDKYNEMDKGDNKEFDKATVVWIKLQEKEAELNGRIAQKKEDLDEFEKLLNSWFEYFEGVDKKSRITITRLLRLRDSILKELKQQRSLIE